MNQPLLCELLICSTPECIAELEKRSLHWPPAAYNAFVALVAYPWRTLGDPFCLLTQAKRVLHRSATAANLRGFDEVLKIQTQQPDSGPEVKAEVKAAWRLVVAEMNRIATDPTLPRLSMISCYHPPAQVPVLRFQL